MSFAIDTGLDATHSGAYRMDSTEALMDAILDALPHDAPQEKIDADLAMAIMGVLHAPKTAATVRRKLIMHWHLIMPLADRAPDLFDAILFEFADCINRVG